jgi:uncharacterized protein YjbI with pentapeptide repeats
VVRRLEEDSSVDSLECQCEPRFRSACYGAADYEYKDKRYCILHFPSEDKKDDFKEALKNKLEQNDFDFRGAVFPGDTSEFRDFKFNADVVFTSATFCGGADFSDAKFSGARTDFLDADFGGAKTDFSEAKFSSVETDFSDAKFSSAETDFSNARRSPRRTARVIGTSRTSFTEASCSTT